MRTVHRYWLLGLVLGIVMLATCSALGGRDVHAATAYVDEERRFTFLVPNGWVAEDSSTASGLVSYASTQPPGEFDLNVFDAGGQDSLDLLVAATERELSNSFDNYTLVGTMPTKLGDESAQLIAYTATASDTLLSFSQILCLHNGSVYALTISASPEGIDSLAAQEIAVLQSWTFI